MNAPTIAQSLMNASAKDFDEAMKVAERDYFNIYQSDQYGTVKLYQFKDGSMLLRKPDTLSLVADNACTSIEQVREMLGIMVPLLPKKADIITALDYKLIVDHDLPSYSELLLTARRMAQTVTNLVPPYANNSYRRQEAMDAGHFLTRMDEKVGDGTIAFLEQRAEEAKEMPF